MNDKTTKMAYTVAIVGGAILWLATVAISGKGEAWDSPLYWTVAYPLSILLAGVLGYRFPEKPWRWGLAVMLAQAVVLAITAASFGLLPLGLIVFATLSLPAIGFAKLMSWVRLRKADAAADN